VHMQPLATRPCLGLRAWVTRPCVALNLTACSGSRSRSRARPCSRRGPRTTLSPRAVGGCPSSRLLYQTNVSSAIFLDRRTFADHQVETPLPDAFQHFDVHVPPDLRRRPPCLPAPEADRTTKHAARDSSGRSRAPKVDVWLTRPRSAARPARQSRRDSGSKSQPRCEHVRRGAGR